MADPSTSINSGEVWGVMDKKGHNGACTCPGIVCLVVGQVWNVDGVKEGMRGDVGNKTSWRDGVLVPGRLIIDIRNGVFTVLRHGFCPDSKLGDTENHRGCWARRSGRDSGGGRHSC